MILPPGSTTVGLTIETEQEDDGRWLAEVPQLSGVLAYGQTRAEAIDHVKALALRVIADRLDHGEPVPELERVFAVVA
jgi:predicted RNase H-like HicB family nuclease